MVQVGGLLEERVEAAVHVHLPLDLVDGAHHAHGDGAPAEELLVLVGGLHLGDDGLLHEAVRGVPGADVPQDDEDGVEELGVDRGRPLRDGP